MDVVHLSAHLRRMHDAVFGAAPRGAVLLGNARSPITCSAPGTACATRRPRARANRPVPNGARRRTCHAPPVLARNQQVLRRNHRRCQQRQGLGVRSGREAHCRLQLPHPGAGQRRHVHAAHRGLRRVRGRAGGRFPLGAGRFLCQQTQPLWHVFHRGWASSRASTAVRHSPPCICPLPFGECTGPNKVQRPGSASFSAMQELNSHATAACMPSLHAMCPIRLVPIACNAPARSIIRGRGRARGRKPSASKCVRVAMCRWRSQRMALRFAD